MKRALSLVLLVIGLLFLAGCTQVVDNDSLELNGEEIIVLEVNSTYLEEGAVCVIVEGDCSVNIEGSVDIDVVGEYSIVYIAKTGNDIVEELTRFISVVDTTPPVMVRVGSMLLLSEIGEVFDDPGVTCVDNYDDSCEVIVVGKVNSSEAGDYTLSYIGTDSSGNESVIFRTVSVLDTLPPTFDILSTHTIEVNSSDVDWTSYVYNISDGSETDVSVEEIQDNVVYDRVGTYSVSLKISDGSDNTRIEVIAVDVVDTEAPTFNDIEDQSVYVDSATLNWANLVRGADDNSSSELSISFVSNVEYDVIGEYLVTITVADEFLNETSKSFKVNVVSVPVIIPKEDPDTIAPVISLNGASVITSEIGATYTDLGASASDDYDSVVSIQIVSNVDINTIGAYQVTYDAVDSAGNEANQVIRTVNVADTTIPVVTITGSGTINIEVGSAYTELGATVTDTYDSGVTVVTSGIVNSGVVGIYTVYYNAQDASGNDAVQVTRTVNVVDTTVPVINLIGSGTLTVEAFSGVYSDPGASITENYDSGIALITSGLVDTDTSGVYILYYNAQDASGNDAVQVTRTVTIVDTTAPTFNPIGVTGISTQGGDIDWATYVVNRLDNSDSVLVALETADTVDETIVGSGSVTVTLTDGNGNVATETFTVNVS